METLSGNRPKNHLFNEPKQILIAAGSVDGGGPKLRMFGFQAPSRSVDWALYLTVDLVQCVVTVALAFFHFRRNARYQTHRLNVLNVERVLRHLRASLPQFSGLDSHLSSIISEDEEDDLDLPPSPHRDDNDSNPMLYDVPSSKSNLLRRAKTERLPFYYQFAVSLLLLVVSIAAPSVLHIAYLLVILLLCLSSIAPLWRSTSSMFHLMGPLYLWLHLLLISVFQVQAVRDAVDSKTANVLGLEDLHQNYWSDWTLIVDQHIVPNLVSTVMALLLFYLLGLRPVLLHCSLYRAPPPDATPKLLQHHSSRFASSPYLSPPQMRKRPVSAVSLPPALRSQRGSSHKSKIKTKSKRSASSKTVYRSMADTEAVDGREPLESEYKGPIKRFAPQSASDAVEDEEHGDGRPVVNVSATQFIADRRDTITDTIYHRLATPEPSPSMEPPVVMQYRKSKRRKKFKALKKRTATSESESDSEDETMAKLEKREDMARLRAQSKLRLNARRQSVGSTRSATSRGSSSRSLFSAQEYVENVGYRWLAMVGQFVEGTSEWVKWRFFLWGPLICQLVCLWSCFPHQDAFYIAVMMWSYCSLFLLSARFVSRDGFRFGVISIMLYSMCTAFIKYIAYIPSLYEAEDASTSEYFNYFGMENYGDLNGSYVFTHSLSLILTLYVCHALI